MVFYVSKEIKNCMKNFLVFVSKMVLFVVQIPDSEWGYQVIYPFLAYKFLVVQDIHTGLLSQTS